MGPSELEKRLDISTIGYLLGELGIEILTLIFQGCQTNADITRLGTISKSCLAVKIPLLSTLGLIRIEKGRYLKTQYGSKVLKELVGWNV